jgi:hypothetical protein
MNESKGRQCEKNSYNSALIRRLNQLQNIEGDSAGNLLTWSFRFFSDPFLEFVVGTLFVNVLEDFACMLK